MTGAVHVRVVHFDLRQDVSPFTATGALAMTGRIVGKPET